MKVKSFFVGFVVGLLLATLIVIVLAIYTTSKILPRIEREASLKEYQLDKSIIRLDTIANMESFRVTEINDSLKISHIPLNSKGIVVVNFWATWCGPCIREMDSFVKLSKRTDTDSIDFFFLSNESLDKQKKFIQTKNWNLPFYQYSKEPQFFLEPRKWPTTLILKGGIVYLKVEGEYKWDSDEIFLFLGGLK
ncbi:MAG: redoxin domain-containing protein [Cyclobacteriaceae bacterium]|nr:redoxin domain-containing protein [Cyclobacteriaceae bacterium]